MESIFRPMSKENFSKEQTLAPLSDQIITGGGGYCLGGAENENCQGKWPVEKKEGESHLSIIPNMPPQ